MLHEVDPVSGGVNRSQFNLFVTQQPRASTAQPIEFLDYGEATPICHPSAFSFRNQGSGLNRTENSPRTLGDHPKPAIEDHLKTGQ